MYRTKSLTNLVVELVALSPPLPGVNLGKQEVDDFVVGHGKDIPRRRFVGKTLELV